MTRVSIPVLIMLFALASCSSEEKSLQETKGKGDHVWKTQTDALDKAKGVEQQNTDQFEKQRQMMEDQGG